MLRRLQASPYLSALLKKHPDLLGYAKQEKALNQSCLQAVIDALRQDDFSAEQTAERSDQLRQLKQRFSLLWSIAALSKQIEFSALGKLQSEFAKIGIQTALHIAWHSKRNAKNFIRAASSPLEDSGVFVLALGKLGGEDLNFSSDVDLIAFYDKSKLALAPMCGASHAVSELLKQLSAILSETNEHGFVWRVDWRLRPHAALRNLSMAADKAVDFYHYHARPWHRLAMIKARPIAGNAQMAQAFLSELRTFLWRYDLDYRAIDEIAKLKDKINLEHPTLSKQRTQDDVNVKLGKGFNLKLGHGGIREIEFVVNALQMLWGGRKPSLQVGSTLQAIKALATEDLLNDEQANALQKAYVFLRNAENQLQMMDNAQVYHLPSDDNNDKSKEQTANFLTLSGYDDWASFNDELSQHREQVYAIFKGLFAGEQAVMDEDKDAASSLTPVFTQNGEALSANAMEIIGVWEDGFIGYGLPNSEAHHFDGLLNALAEEVRLSGCDVSEAIIQIDAYFQKLPKGGQYFRLLRDYPWLLEKLIRPLLLSPTMAILLEQSPHIIDRFLEAEEEGDTLDTTIIFSNSDYEYRLENLRRVANEALYLRYLQYFERKVSPRSFQKSLTLLAENLLKAALQIACDEMDLEEPPVAIIGFGKLGSQAMMPKSDLDLVYLCGSMEAHSLASSFASRLNTIISAPMKEGRVYELDTRLRPSGRSGSVTISVESYRRHQLTQAHTWPHLALVSARFVAGNQQIAAQFAEIKYAVLSRIREPLQCKMDCAKMLKRVREQKETTVLPNQFLAKSRRGGLFELEYLIACYAVLQGHEFEENPGLSFHERAILLDKQNHFDIVSALETLRSLQLEIRLFGGDGEFFEALPKAVLKHVLAVLGCQDIAALIQTINAALAQSCQLAEQFFLEVDWASLPQWKEEKVRWLSA